RPSAQDRHVAAIADLADLAFRLGTEVRDTGGLGDLQHVEPMVRDPAPLSRRELGGPDVHPAVLLHGVAVDDLTAESLGEAEGQLGLPRPGRPHHGDGDTPGHDGAPGSPGVVAGASSPTAACAAATGGHHAL